MSIPTPGGLDPSGSVLVARAFTDPFGQRRLRLVGTGTVANGRIAIGPNVAGVQLEGVRGAGDYVFLRVDGPVGFITGLVRRSGNPASGVLVTGDALPLADVTASAGAYVLAAAAGVDTIVRGVERGAAATASVRVPSAGSIATADLALSNLTLSVLTVSPVSAAVQVALDASVVIEFSAAVDAGSITAASVALQLSGVPVAAQLTVSADRRRVTLRPAAPLQPLTTYTLVISSAVRDGVGQALTPFTGATFLTLDPSRPALPTGQIVASLPGPDGVVLVVGSPGAAAGATAVSLTNVRTQETVSQLALADGPSASGSPRSSVTI